MTTGLRALGRKVRQRFALAVLRRSGLRAMEPVRNLASTAIGIGSASLSIEESGEEALLRDLASRWSRSEEVLVFDVGGYAGDYTIAARRAFGPKAQIHCFEPNPHLFGSLVRRVDGPRTFCHNAALGAEPGSLPLFLDADSSPRASLVEASFPLTGTAIAERHAVAVQTVDQLADELRLERIGLLKLDVEGHELAVLQGAEHLLTREGGIRVVQFEFGERNLASRTYLRDFFELLPHHDFFRVTPRGLLPIAYRPSLEVFTLETNYVAIFERPRSRRSAR